MITKLIIQARVDKDTLYDEIDVDIATWKLMKDAAEMREINLDWMPGRYANYYVIIHERITPADEVLNIGDIEAFTNYTEETTLTHKERHKFLFPTKKQAKEYRKRMFRELLVESQRGQNE